MTTAVDVQQMLTPSRVGQATAVEQSRAIAEVHAAIVVAQQCPRDVQQAIRDMRDSCRQRALADRAFFRYSRGGGPVTGPSIHLARELGRCWGNIQWGINEMRRDDEYGQSEMQAWAWDVQTNARSSNAFIVPHRRDTSNGPKALTDQRDIYENNANNAARRLREAIFAVLPTWFVEEAKDICNQTLNDGGGKPLAKRVEEALNGFGLMSITEAQLEEKLGLPVAKWTERDVAQLGVIYKSIQRGESLKDEEFPAAQSPARVTVSEIIGGQPDGEAPRPVNQGPHLEPGKHSAPDGSSEPAAPAHEEELATAPGSANTAQVGKLVSLYQSKFGFKRSESGNTVKFSEQIVGRELTGPEEGRVHANLSEAEARKLIDTLDGIADQAELFGRLNADTLDTWAAGEKP
jgi:hypothetical protein